MIRYCGAKNRKGNPCQRVACKNGRCANHGGLSKKGPKNVSESGRLAQKMGSWKHGLRSKEAVEEKRAFRSMMKKYKDSPEELL